MIYKYKIIDQFELDNRNSTVLIVKDKYIYENAYKIKAKLIDCEVDGEKVDFNKVWIELHRTFVDEVYQVVIGIPKIDFSAKEIVLFISETE